MPIDYGMSVVEPSVRWDLTSMEELDIDAVGIEIEAACRRFGERHRGRIGFLGPEELAGALEELEWLALPDARVEELCASPALGHVRHMLRSIRRFAPHVLSEAEERALAAREPGAFEAWLALYEQVAWTIELELEGRSVAIYEA